MDARVWGYAPNLTLQWRELQASHGVAWGKTGGCTFRVQNFTQSSCSQPHSSSYSLCCNFFKLRPSPSSQEQIACLLLGKGASLNGIVGGDLGDIVLHCTLSSISFGLGFICHLLQDPWPLPHRLSCSRVTSPSFRIRVRLVRVTYGTQASVHLCSCLNSVFLFSQD